MPPVVVDVPPLSYGADILDRMEVREALDPWDTPSFISVEGLLFEAPDAIVHSSAGVMGVDGQVVRDTLLHTHPGRHRYRLTESSIDLVMTRVEHLEGVYISLLTGSSDNYYHSMLDGVARLSVLSEDQIAEANGILIPADGCGPDEFFSLYPLPTHLDVRRVSFDQTFRVDRLLYPNTMHGLCSYHPRILDVFDTLGTHVVPDDADRPKRVYVDRRRAWARRLSNEDEVVATLTRYGFVPVCLEDLGLIEQMALFRQADVIVAPHGAGLTNIVFSRPGCRVVELVMDAYLHEGFRRLAAVRKISYDCVIGHADKPWPALGIAIHGLTWRIQLDDVIAAVERALTDDPHNRSQAELDDARGDAV